VSYLLDTNILSETRKRRRDPGVVEWLSAVSPQRTYVSALTIGEIQQGIAQLLRRGDQRQATLIETWLDGVLDEFAGRVVPVSLQIARNWGSQSTADPLPIIDALIAATATVHGWTVVSRNAKDFESLGIPVLNPFTS
jgi:predicted nucleic acid-binding protein